MNGRILRIIFRIRSAGSEERGSYGKGTHYKPMNIQGVRAHFVAFVDGGFPGWVRIEIRDAIAQRHSFIEKVPVVTALELDASSNYPIEIVIHAEVIATWQTAEGQCVSTIDTSRPWGLETVAGLSTFDMAANELVDV